MKVSTENILNAIQQWIENDVLSKGNPWQKAGTTFLYLQSKEKISSIIRQNISMLADEQGLFDVDTLKANLNTALNKAGNVLNVPLINYRIDTKDLNTIFTYLQEQSNENSRGI